MAQLKNRCDSCKQSFKLDRGNAVVHNYPFAPFLTYWDATCPNCQAEEIIFIRENEHKVDEILEMDFETVAHTHIDRQVRGWYEGACNIKLIEQVELLPRHEQIIGVMRWELEHCVGIADILAIEIENRLPRKWL